MKNKSSNKSILRISTFALLLIYCFAEMAYSQVIGYQKISDIEGGFSGILDNDDWFGHDTAYIGDLNGDGISDLAVGGWHDDDGGTDRGAVWILFMNADGTVNEHQKISNDTPGFSETLHNGDEFGIAITSIGDLDDDGVTDLAVGARYDDDGGTNCGAVWLFFLNTDGSIKSYKKISNTNVDFTGTLDAGDWFGDGIANLGDVNGDGVTDLAVGAFCDDDGDTDHGAVWILFLNEDGTVKSHQKISDTEGGFMGALDTYDGFGCSVEPLGDIDGDGLCDIAIGAQYDDDGGLSHGAVWILFLNEDGTVKSHQKISDTEGGFMGVLENHNYFGTELELLNDLNGDGINDLAVGANFDNDGGSAIGAVWILFLNEDGTVKSHQKISSTEGGFTGTLHDGDMFGGAIESIGDINGDGKLDLAVGAYYDDDGGANRGAVWILFTDYSLPEPVYVEQDETTIPKEYCLAPNFPNPFNPSTTIQYAIPEGKSFHVKLNVYDLRGALVRTLVNQVINHGIHSVVWDGIDTTGNEVSSGVYIYRIQAGGFSKTNKMLLIR